MNSPRRTLWTVLLVGFALALCAAERAVFFYTKKRQTELLPSPRSRETPVATIPFREKLEMIERDGPWIKVAAKFGSGWVYEGNLTDKEPHKDVNLEFLPSSASSTTASVAARPLSEVARGYAGMKGKAAAAADVEWLEREADGVSASEVEKHLVAEKRGEFR